MNKTAIKNFAIWARNKLIADISYKAGLLGITEKGIKNPLPQSTQTVQFFDIGTKEPSSITGLAIEQRKRLVEEIQRKAKDNDHATAYKNVIEEVAYTWFNRLIAIRFMEVNDYLPTRMRVLSSEGTGKAEPDLVTHALDANLDYSAYEKDRIIQLKHDNKLDELFRMLFIKQCNSLNANLPELFEKTSDYTELLLNVSFTDREGVVYHLVNDISEDDFNVTKEGQVEIIGWMYQYYITELNELVYDGTFSKNRIPKELLSAATTIYTPDWAIRYMVDNSLGKLFVGKHPQLKSELRYFLDSEIPESNVRVEDIRLLDPCMGSGHILVYAFDVFMQIYRAEGYSERDAAKLILEKNIYGLDIDKRAYQLAYFALMMKARQYNRRILNGEVTLQVYCPAGYADGEEYGSILRISELEPKPEEAKESQITLFDESYATKLNTWNFRSILSQKYDVVITNPPYLGSSRFSPKLSEYVNSHYPEVKSDLSMVMYKHALQDLSKCNGYVAFITTSSWMFLSSFEKLRTYVLNNFDFDTLVDFGSELFDGKVGHNLIAAWVNRNSSTNKKMTAIRLVDYCYSRRDEKEPEFFNHANRHTANTKNYKKIPGSPVAYWLSEKMSLAFDTGKLISKLASVSEGIKTGNNDLFLKFWHEVEAPLFSFEDVPDSYKWIPHHKGGDYRKWYGNMEWVINWANNGSEIKNSSNSGLQGKEMYFKPVICWSKITSKGASFRYIRENCLFDSGSPACMPINHLYYVMGFLNSIVCKQILVATNPTLNTQVGNIKGLPVIFENTEITTRIVEACITLSRNDWDSFEVSWDFKRHPILCGERTIAAAFTKWEREAAERFDTLKANEEELNHIFIDIYGLQDELTPEVEDKDVTVRRVDLGREIRSLISYAVGCMFGRYSPDTEGLAYAGGDWDAGKYCSFIPDKDNILPICDDEYFDDDIIGRFVEFVKIVFGANTLEENLKFIASALGGKGTPREIIRDYFLSEFYKDHCKIYQKRPIYWLFDSGKQNGFKALIYMHRYDENTIGNLRIDYLHRMQRIFENEINRMQDTIENSKDARDVTKATKQKEKIIKQLQETKDYDEKIAHLALARTSIDLDDGVKVNYEKVQTDRDGKKIEVLAKI